MNQQIIEIKSADILKQVSRFKREHARLVQILCTRVEEGYELTYTFDKDYFMYHLRCLVPVYRSVMSITGQYWYAFVWENEIHDLFGLKIDFIERDVDYGGHFYHLAEKTPWHNLPGEKHADQAIKVQLRSGLGIDASAVAGRNRKEGKKMGKSTVIPFGPQHPVLPEPIHLDLELQDEKVVRAVPSIGYVHRGLEKLVELRDFQQYVYVAERVCGICSFGHGWGYSRAVEEMMEIEVPPRAEWLRTIWHELSRIHSHLLWLGLAADAMGFESLFMEAWRLREIDLDLIEQTTGGRIIFSVCKVGGVRRDIGGAVLKEMKRVLKDLSEKFLPMLNVFMDDDTVHSRLKGVGKLTMEEALELGCIGPMARASGILTDIRAAEKDSVYGQLHFQPVIETDGDCYARARVRLREVLRSVEIIEGCIDNIPDGPIDVKVRGVPPKRECFVRVEQPRGEALYYVKGNGTKFLERFRLRTPTNANLPALVKMLQGCDLADVPNIILTIDPCISCCER